VSVDATLAALAAPVRRAAVEQLRAGPLRPAELADRLQTSRPALTRHLRVLRDAGLVHEVPDPADGRSRTLHLRPEPLDDLAAWVAQTRAFWSDALDGFAAYVEEA
jgi:DNA-binding transcriptional ArsR family regulator